MAAADAEFARALLDARALKHEAVQVILAAGAPLPWDDPDSSG